MHPSIPENTVNGNSTFEYCHDLLQTEFPELDELKPLTYFPEGPIYLLDPADPEAEKYKQYPLQGELTQQQLNQTKRLWGMQNAKAAQSAVRYAYLNKWLAGLSRMELVKEIKSRGIELTTWETRTMKSEELRELWIPTEDELR